MAPSPQRSEGRHDSAGAGAASPSPSPDDTSEAVPRLFQLLPLAFGSAGLSIAAVLFRSHGPTIGWLSVSLAASLALVVWCGLKARHHRSRARRLLEVLRREVEERARAESSLLESETLYRTLFDNAPIGLGIADEEGRLIAFNDGMLEPGGYRREDFDDVRSVARLYRDPADRDRVLAMLRRDGRVKQEPVRFLRADGGFYDALLSLTPVTVNGRRCVQAMTEDVTDRVRAERLLRESEEAYRSLVESVPDHISIFDEQGRMLFLNRNSPDYPEHDVRGTRGEDYVSEATRADFRRAIANAFAGETTECRIEDVMGRVYLSRYVPLRRDGKVVSALCVSTDLTERERAAAAVAESEERYRQLLETAPVTICTVSPDLEVRYINRLAAGYSRDAVVGRRSVDLVADESREPMRDALERVFRGESVELGFGDLFGRRYHGRFVPVLREGRVVEALTLSTDITDLELAEGVMRRSVAMVRRIVEAVPGGVVHVGEDGRLLECNANACEILGLDRARLLSMNLRDFTDATLREDGSPMPHAEYPVFRCLETREPQPPATVGVRRADGSISWSVFTATPVDDPETGEPAGAVVTFLDITARREVERRALEAEERYARAVESGRVGVWEWNEAARALVVSPHMSAMLGEPPGAIGTDWRAWVERTPPADRERLAQASQRLYAGASDFQVEHRMNLRDGSTRWFLTRGAAVRDESGRLVRLIGTTVDITEVQRAREALREQAEEFELIFDTAPSLVFFKDTRNNILRVNEAVVRATGLPRESLQGRPMAEIFPESAEQSGRDDRVVVETNRPMLGGVRELRLPSGETLRARIDRAPYHDSEGRVAGVVVIATDVTQLERAEEERRRLEAQMRQAQKLESLGVLAGGIAHDFNNLLVGILGNAGLALMDLAADSPAREAVSNIESAAARAAELTRQMLAYSGKGRFVVESIDLSRLVEEMARLLQVSIGRNAVLRFDFATDLPRFEGDATQIRQVVMNLITNAGDAVAEAGGAIAIATGRVRASSGFFADAYLDDALPEGEYVFVEVTDTGTGMDDATRARIFDPFFTTKFTGRGLGLAATLGIVRGHRGAIKVRSAPGIGSTFAVFFPARAGRPANDGAPDEAGSNAPVRAPDTSGIRIGPAGERGAVLVIDDEDAVRDVVRAALERAGFEVLEAADGATGIERMREGGEAIVAAILDLTMPGIGGAETLRELRRIRSDLPALVMSGYSEQDAADRFGPDESPDGFLQKPFRAADLPPAVERAVRARSGGGGGK